MTLQAVVLSADWFRFVGALVVLSTVVLVIVRIAEWAEQ